MLLVFSLLLAFVLQGFAYAAWRQAQAPGSASAPPPPWALTLRSTLAFALAFNLVFFVQEMALVLPKSWTPGLEPTLFHNNHTWSGTHPRVDLLQGTGALGTVILSLLATLWLVRAPPRHLGLRFVVFWLAVLGFLAALPQVVLGAAIHGNDVGRALTGLGFPDAVRWSLAGFAMLAMVGICHGLVAYLPGLAEAPATPAGRARAAWRLAALPCLLAQPLIVPFRVPNSALEMLLPPVLDGLIAAAWLWAAAWRLPAARSAPVTSPGPVAPLLVALAALLAFFQLVLARGVAL